MAAQLELASPPTAESRASDSTSEISIEIAPLHSSTRIPVLDGLRGIAILLVLYYHQIAIPLGNLPVSSRLPKPFLSLGLLGWSGVDLFFVLSGFLIGGILLDARSSANYFKTFYIRRAYRILPLYAVLLALLFAGGLILTGAGPIKLSSLFVGSIPWWSYLTFTQNLWMAGIGSFGALFMAVSWSLAIEEQFYLTLPLAVRFLNEKLLFRFLIGTVFAAPFLRVAIYLMHPPDRLAPYVLMPCRADALVLGVLAALLLRKKRVWDFICSHNSIVNGIFALLLSAVVFLGVKGYGFKSGTMISAGYTCLALFYVSLLVLVVTQPRSLLGRILVTPFLITIGQLAYGIYLLHEIVSWLCHVYLPLEPRSLESEFLVELLVLLLVYGIARISWTYFEKPMLRRAYRYTY